MTFERPAYMISTSAVWGTDDRDRPVRDTRRKRQRVGWSCSKDLHTVDCGGTAFEAGDSL